MHLFIPKGFKCNEFVRADSKGFAGAFFVRAHCKGVTGFRQHQNIAPPKSREALSAAALSLVWSFPVARSSHFWTPIGIRPGDSSILRAAMLTTGRKTVSSHRAVLASARQAHRLDASSGRVCLPHRLASKRGAPLALVGNTVRSVTQNSYRKSRRRMPSIELLNS